jgi:ligand-binding sensor domain-containing protein
MKPQPTMRSAALILFFVVASTGCKPNPATEAMEMETAIPLDTHTRPAPYITPTFSATPLPTPDPRAGWTSFTSRINSAWDMEADKDGYLWVVPRGNEGILRWDVKEKTYVRFAAADGLPDESISSVAVAPDGGVWVSFGPQLNLTASIYDASKNEIAHFEKGEWISYSVPTKTYGGIESMAVASDGVIWMVVDNDVISYDGDSWQRYDEEIGRFSEKPYQGPVFSIIATAPDGTVWVVTDTKGILRYDGSTWMEVSGRDGLSDEGIESLSIGPDGMVWVVADRHMSVYDGSVWMDISEDVIGRCGTDLLIAAADKKAWLVNCAGIIRTDGVTSDAFLADRWTTGFEEHCYDLDYCLPFDYEYISAYAIDQEGSLWIGTESQGVFRFDGERIDAYTAGLIGNNFRSIVTVPNGTVWVNSVEDGVSRFDGRLWSGFLPTPGLPLNEVYGIGASPDGSVWFSCWDNSLLQYTEGTWRTFSYSGPGGLGGIPEIAPDGSVWIPAADRSGVVRFKDNAWKNLRIDARAGGYEDFNTVRTIAAGADGTMWFGTQGGIARWQNGKWSTFAIPSELINSIVVSKKGEIWFSALDSYTGPMSGRDKFYFVARFNESEKLFYDRQELVGRFTWAIAEAPDGALWFGGDTGLRRLAGSVWKQWGEEIGLGTVGDIAVAEDGTVWMLEADVITRFQFSEAIG